MANYCLLLCITMQTIVSDVKSSFEIPRGASWIAAIDYIAVSVFEPLLPTRKTGGLMRVGQPLRMRARIPVQWQTNYDVYKNESKP